jgi:hypothetical protein
MAYTTGLGTPGKDRIVENDTSVGAGSGYREEVIIRGPGGTAPSFGAGVADGADVTQGAKADAAASTDIGTFSLIALFKRLLQKFTTQFPAALDTSGAFKVGNSPLSVAIEGAHSQDTTIDSVTTITPTGDYLIMQATVAGKNIRMTFDGVNPTTSFGFVLVAQDPPIRIATAGKTIKVIAETAGAAIDWQNEQGV